jgi:tetratricopeptide (TPR) repeat protein
MDGRRSHWMLLGFLLPGLLLAASGCVTTHEKQVTIRDQADPVAAAAAAKNDAKKPVPQRLLFAIAEAKERDADAATDNPEGQARMRDEARQTYQKILEADPKQLDACRGLARVYAKMGDYTRAQETYQKALAKNPRDVTLWYDLGMMHDRRKDFAAGAQCFKKALDIDPENQRCLKALGFTLARAGQMTESVTYLARAMGSLAAAHCNVAQMLLHLSEQEQGEARAQREEQARQHLQAALKENPACARAHELLASLEAATAPTRAAVEIQFAEPGH